MQVVMLSTTTCSRLSDKTVAHNETLSLLEVVPCCSLLSYTSKNLNLQFVIEILHTCECRDYYVQRGPEFVKGGISDPTYLS